MQMKQIKFNCFLLNQKIKAPKFATAINLYIYSRFFFLHIQNDNK